MSTATAAPAAHSTTHGGDRTHLVAETWRVMRRELRPVLREPWSMVMALAQPLVFLGLFAPLLPGTGGTGLQWFVPGIVVMAALVGATMTGANLTEEIASGSHERQLVSPVSRAALIVGRAAKEAVPMVLQTLLIVLVCAPFSFDLHPVGVAGGMLLLAPFCIGVGALSYALAIVAAGNDWLFWTIQQTLLFPLLLLAGVLLPVEGAPGWLEVLSRVNPLTPIVDAERALLDGRFPTAELATGAGAALAVLVIGLAVGVRTMARAAR